MSKDINETTTIMTHEEQKAVYETRTVLAEKSKILMRIGQTQAFNLIAKQATVSEILLFREIKKSKEYKGLSYFKNGKTETVSTLEEFCPIFLNRSYRTMDELDNNLEVFGQEFFEQAQRLGLGYRELRKLRSLPEDDRLQVIELDAIENGDKDSIREVIDELHFKHKQESQQLNAKIKDAEADLVATRELNAEKTQREEELKIKLEKARYTPENWPKHAADLVQELLLAATEALTGIDKMRQMIDHISTLSAQYEDSAEIQYHANSVFSGLSRDVAERAALMMQDGETLLHYTDVIRPADEVLQELADKAAAKDMSN